MPTSERPYAGKVKAFRTPSGSQIVHEAELRRWLDTGKVVGMNVVVELDGSVKPSEATLKLVEQLQESYGPKEEPKEEQKEEAKKESALDRARKEQ